MSKQKRYATPLDADLEILRLKKLSQSRLRSAERRDAEADGLRDQANKSDISELRLADLRRQMEERRSKAKRLRGHANYILNRRIPAIGRTKAKLLTKPMEFMQGDASVSEEPV